MQVLNNDCILRHRARACLNLSAPIFVALDALTRMGMPLIDTVPVTLQLRLLLCNPEAQVTATDEATSQTCNRAGQWGNVSSGWYMLKYMFPNRSV